MHDRYAKARQWLTNAASVSPGASQTASKSPGSVGPVGSFPLVIESARGSRVLDIDGNQYIDWFNGNCSVILGHGNETVSRDVEIAIRQYGALPSLPTDLERQAAETVLRFYPGAEQVRFVKTGSEACAGAVRLARMATGRDLVLCAGGQYHGWHDWHCVTKPWHPGVPDVFEGVVKTFAWKNRDSLAAALKKASVAAVIVEPALPERPDPEWLSDLVSMAHDAGALVIFDEMICGARLHVGGAQGYTGIRADLTTGGKAYGNGHAVAFIAGQEKVMRHAWPVSGTFGGDVVGLAALTTVGRLLTRMDGAYLECLHRRGQQLMDSFNAIGEREGGWFYLSGHPCRPAIKTDVTGQTRVLALSVLQQELAARGVLTHWSAMNPGALHSPDDLDCTLMAVNGALAAIRRPDIWKDMLRGDLIRMTGPRFL